ncbi:unnamed protein product [Coffea canephora]|uniref:Non-haem dioxygenase N-terminal domain-containing protein n=1 Tax=Coffea canephora TaxID=49390 RepID=A0A068UQ45_COFCA|nr:unnamed protein product [Coffea canephora]
MANLLSSWSSDLDSLPEKYIVPEEKRPGALLAPVSKDIPAIDLSEGDRASIIQKIMKASQEFGFFQVINHGVSEKLMIDAVNVGKEFFSMPAEEMENFAAKDSRKGCKVYTGSGNCGSHDFGLWRDTLQHPCHPLEKWTNIFPDKPAGYRGTTGPYTVEVRKLGIRILDMICEGLGLTEENYDYHDLLLMIHNYPACPDPSSALGVSGHRWPMDWCGTSSKCFCIPISFSMEVHIQLRSAVHRMVTNSACSRTSLVNFFNCPSDRLIEPVKSLVSPSDPPAFRAFHMKEYLEVLFGKNSDSEVTAEYFKIKSQASK